MEEILRNKKSITIDFDQLDRLRKKVLKVAKEEFGYHTVVDQFKIKSGLVLDSTRERLVIEFRCYNFLKEDAMEIEVLVDGLGDILETYWATVTKPVDV